MARTNFQRDINVLTALSAGPASMGYLYREYYRKGPREWVSRQAFEKHINKLIKCGWIDVIKISNRKWQNSRVRLAVLLDTGANMLAESNPSLEREYMRVHAPHKAAGKKGKKKRQDIYHELVLSDIIRAIWKESREKRNFAIEYLYDEKVMKSKIFKKRGSRKNIFYPDLRVRIHTLSYGTFSFNVEIDTGQKTQGYWTRKICSWPESNLVISTEPGRVERLARWASNARDAGDLRGIICFSSYSDFLNSGLRYWIPELCQTESDPRVHMFKEG